MSEKMPENTAEQIIDKIDTIAWEIRGDWSDPRNECREISMLCRKLKKILSEDEADEILDGEK